MKKLYILIIPILLYSCDNELQLKPQESQVELDNTSSLNDNYTSQSSTLVMVANYDNCQDNSGIDEIGANIPSPSRRYLDSEIPRQGACAIKHKLYITDPEDPVAGSARSESHNLDLISARISPNQIRYYGFLIYFPTTWVTDGNSDDIVFQWKGFDTPPFMFITQKYEDIILRWNYAIGQDTIKMSSVLAPICKGNWHDFRIRVVWKPDGTEGRINVDHKLKSDNTYTRVLNYAGPNMFNVSGYLKWGIYKPSWDDNAINYSGQVTQRVSWHDNIKIGSNWNEVDPAY